MPIICCYVNMFENIQHIVVLGTNKSDQFVVDTDGLNNMLFNLCQQYSTNKIHLFGQEIYLQDIVYKLREAQTIEYNIDNLEIEVN